VRSCHTWADLPYQQVTSGDVQTLARGRVSVAIRTLLWSEIHIPLLLMVVVILDLIMTHNHNHILGTPTKYNVLLISARTDGATIGGEVGGWVVGKRDLRAVL
jgi:hypothetical protein